MSHRQNPPRQSPAQRARKPVTVHNEASVGHGLTKARKPTILDPENGRDFDGGAGNAPGAGGSPTTGAIWPGI
jgi:hypothetical protein